MAIYKVKVIKDFGDVKAKDKDGNEKAKYGMRPKVGATIRLNEHDYNMVKADKLVEDVKKK